MIHFLYCFDFQVTEEVLDAELREEDLGNPENVEPANVDEGSVLQFAFLLKHYMFLILN